MKPSKGFSLFIVIFLLMVYNLPSFGEVIITDGDTIWWKGEKIRLEGIDAPEAKQLCKKNNIPWMCGAKASEALEKLIGKASNNELFCEGKTKDKYGRRIATCFYKTININKWLVENGWAVAYRYYSKRYIKYENVAKLKRRGLWQGDFISPANWRKGQRLSDNKTGSLCKIKGNISSSGEKIFHILGGLFYEKTKISKQKGERWFCSEEMALRNGWRKSKR
jgi:endonuclease YncB( thermonuclease family)